MNSNIISLLHFNENLTKDECNNIWIIYNPKLSFKDEEYYKFDNSSYKIKGYSYIYTKDIDTNKLFNNNFTIDFWFSLDKYIYDGGIISCAIKKRYGFSLIIHKELKTLELCINSNNGYIDFILNKKIELNTWYHIAFSKNNKTLKYFINGELKHEFNNMVFIGLGDSIVLGNYHYINPNSDNFQGNIDEFRITNKDMYNSSNFILPTSSYNLDSYIENNTIKYITKDIVLNTNTIKQIKDLNKTIFNTIQYIIFNSTNKIIFKRRIFINIKIKNCTIREIKYIKKTEVNYNATIYSFIFNPLFKYNPK